MFIVPITGMYGISRPYLLERFNEFLHLEADQSMTTQKFTQFMNKKGFEFEPMPRHGTKEDMGLVDDYLSNKRNRLKNYGYQN